MLTDNFMTGEIKDWSAYLSETDKEIDKNLFIKHATVGRPLGQKSFITKLEKITGRKLRRQKPGPKRSN